MATTTETNPIGSMKKLVSLVDRGGFDQIAYPKDGKSTLYQPTFEAYHPFITDVHVWPFSGSAEWGKRITFTVPQPWEADLLSWVALRIKPTHWLPANAYSHLYVKKDWQYIDSTREWTWAKSLGSVAIAKAELEIDGVTVEQWSGDWISVWSRLAMDCGKGIGWDDSVLGPMGGTEDGSVYCYLPFWFARHTNVSYPLISTSRPLRIHITLRPFHEVVRMVSQNKVCDESPLGASFQILDLTVPFRYIRTVQVGLGVPTMEVAEMVCGTALIDGDLRTAYRDFQHELLMSPVTEFRFGEPLKYTVGIPDGTKITIGLPLEGLSGPISQLVWVVRRKAVESRADWTNYSTVLERDVDPIWNPRNPLLCRAQLLLGTAVWFDEEESVVRQVGALPTAGGIRAFGNYIYCWNFSERPTAFDPRGSTNASRVDVRLTLEITQPIDSMGVVDKEWEVLVWAVGINWMQFANGVPNRKYMD
jgi:hypothetical protein